METAGWPPMPMVIHESRMPDTHTASNTALLRSLGRLVRGLSALFWGLPIALLVCVQTARTDTLQMFGMLPAAVVTGWLVFGLWQLGHFQKQERVWVQVLDRAKLLGLVIFGLSPFLHWWNEMPSMPFFTAVVGLMAGCALLFLSSLNTVIYRLSAMLPDESLRIEAKSFTTLNRVLLLGIMLLGVAYLLLLHFPGLPVPGQFLTLVDAGGIWLMVFLALPPLAMTMALIWKTKEAIMDSVFGAGH
jgi:hypothetical protein